MPPIINIWKKDQFHIQVSPAMTEPINQINKYQKFQCSQSQEITLISDLTALSKNIHPNQTDFLIKRQSQRQTAIRLFMQIANGRICQKQLKIQNEANQAETKRTVIDFTKNNLTAFFELDFSNTLTRYCSTKSEPQIYRHLYKYLYQQMRYLENNDVHKMKNVKMRTTIVRRVLDKYVSHHFHLSEAEAQHIERYKKRLTKVDRAKYQKLNIPEPPSRMNAEYHHRIFSIKQFRSYYREYITQNQLQLYLLKVQQQQIEDYWEKVTGILNSYTDSDSTESILQGMNKIKALSRRPVFYKQIQQYCKQARRILLQFCS